MADSIVKISFDTMEFSRMYDNDDPKSAKKLFHCNEEIMLGTKWFIASENLESMLENVGAYLYSVENTLAVYNCLCLPFDNKKEMIKALNSLHCHLVELQQRILKTYYKSLK